MDKIGINIIMLKEYLPVFPKRLSHVYVSVMEKKAVDFSTDVCVWVWRALPLSSWKCEVIGHMCEDECSGPLAKITKQRTYHKCPIKKSKK